MSSYPTHDWLSPLAVESLGDFHLTRQIDADLSQRALDAAGDPAARDALFNLLAFKINRFCSRFRRWNLRPWEFEDVRQEAYLAFVDVLNGWQPVPGREVPAGFGYYFMRVYPLRLTDRVRRILRTKRNRPATTSLTDADVDRRDPAEMERDIETLASIIQLSEGLDAADARILLLRTTDDLSPDEIAAQAGVSRRTYFRRWNGIAATIRREAG
ncbi:MAG TPA: sigma-70 family RNA polymerase sigma factor [Thermomicrobiales bacterium]|nr:sigma-70 family RNA polymerase sigma factor [Thermomicrobiales bacterium]